MSINSDTFPNLVFVTGNINKFEEISRFFKEANVPVNLIQRDIDLKELQDTYDAIVYDKLSRANEYIKDCAFCVEDTSFYISALNGFPGPYVKWFLKKDGFLTILSSIQHKSDRNAYAECCIGFMDPTMDKVPFFDNLNIANKNKKNDPKLARRVSLHANTKQNSRLFVGRCYGNIIDLDQSEIDKIKQNNVKLSFGFDPCFIPNGSDVTFANMPTIEKNKISHRGKALSALAEYLKIWARRKESQSLETINQQNDSLVLTTVANYSQYALPCKFISLVAVSFSEGR